MSDKILHLSALLCIGRLCFCVRVSHFLDFLVNGILKNFIHICCAGQLLLAKGEVEQASSAFKIVLEADRDNVPALLGQVY